MKKINIKELYPHLFIIVLFLLLTLVFFYPLLDGKDLRQMDTMHSKAMSKELVDYKNQSGEFSAWTNSMFSGMPSYQIMGSKENNIFNYLTRLFRFGLPYFTIAILFSYFICFYILLISLKFNHWLSFIGAVIFGLATYNIIAIEAGHVTKGYAISFIPLVIAGIIQVFRGNYLFGLIITSVAAGVEICANHVQITYYLFLMIAVMLIVYLIYAIKNKTLLDYTKKISLLIVAGVLAILPNVSSLWMTYEYGKYTIRGPSELTDTGKKEEKVSKGLDREYAFSWSYGKAETATLLIPNFMGGSNNEALDKNSDTYKELKSRGVPNANKIIENMPMYWGDQPFTAGPTYFGAITILLFVIGLFLIKGPEKWWLLVATVFSIVWAWGKNFPFVNDWFFYHFPLYNKFRSVSMALTIAGFTVPFLALLGLNKLTSEMNKETFLKILKRSVYIVGGFALIFALLPGAFFDFIASSDEQLKGAGYPDWLISAIQADRKNLLVSDAWRSLILILLAAGLIALFLFKKLEKKFLYIGLAVLILFDLIRVDKRYLNKDDFAPKREVKQVYTPTQADLQILEDKDPHYRVYNVSGNPFTDAKTSYFHKSIGGYHGAKLRRYQELYDRQISKNNMAVLNMLNAKYFIVPGGENKEAVAQVNPNALGNAWFIKEYKLVANADSEINALTNFDPSKTAIVDKGFKEQLINLPQEIIDTLSKDKIVLTSYKPNHLTYQSTSSSNRLAAFSEIYYDKGWNAYVDGKLKPHFRANYVLRAMVVPAGNHKIEFKFEPVAFNLGNKIDLAGSLLLLILVGWTVVKAVIPIRNLK